MDLSEGYMSHGLQEQFQPASESADPSSVSSLQVSTSPKLPKSPQSLRPQQGQHGSSPGSPLKNQRHSHSKRDDHPKKDGCGGKGAWGGLLDTDDDCVLDLNDPNYNSNEEDRNYIAKKKNSEFEEYKKKAIIIVEEYFANNDAISTANELIELEMSSYDYYFVKKLVSVAMDRHDNEKEMAAVLLSSLYGNVIDPSQVYKGFQKLLESTDDLIVDIPNAVDILALFIARAVVDDILPPSFLTKAMACFSKDLKVYAEIVPLLGIRVTLGLHTRCHNHLRLDFRKQSYSNGNLFAEGLTFWGEDIKVLGRWWKLHQWTNN